MPRAGLRHAGRPNLTWPQSRPARAVVGRVVGIEDAQYTLQFKLSRPVECCRRATESTSLSRTDSWGVGRTIRARLRAAHWQRYCIEALAGSDDGAGTD